MRKNKQKNSKNISEIVYNLLIFRKYCDKIKVKQSMDMLSRGEG